MKYFDESFITCRGSGKFVIQVVKLEKQLILDKDIIEVTILAVQRIIHEESTTVKIVATIIWQAWKQNIQRKLNAETGMKTITIIT